MRGDALVQNQRLMAQAVFALADLVQNSVGFRLTPVAFANLPANPTGGEIACVNDGDLGTGGVVIGGGTHTLLVFYDPTVPAWLYVAGKTAVAAVTLRSITFAELPAVPEQGMLTCVRDSNRDGYGQTITASGPYIVLAFFDGTNWVVK